MATVLVDIDDTLSDTQVAMLEYINRRSQTPYRFEELTRAHREQDIPEYESLVQEFLATPSLVEQTKPYANALTALRRLHAAGFVIHIASSRREPLHDATVRWLERHGFIDYVDTIHPRSSAHRGHEFKRLVAERIRPAAAFDDTYEVAELLAKSDVPVYLIDKPWNRDERLPRNVVRAKDFADAVSRFLASGPAPRN